MAARHSAGSRQAGIRAGRSASAPASVEFLLQDGCLDHILCDKCQGFCLLTDCEVQGGLSGSGGRLRLRGDRWE